MESESKLPSSVLVGFAMLAFARIFSIIWLSEK